MPDFATQAESLFASAGDLWFLAFVGAFFVMICEAAKPKPPKGEAAPEPEGFALWIMIFSLVTPILLLIHAVSVSGQLIAAVALFAGAIIGSALIGWAIAALAPDVGRTLNRAAAILALATFALTLYVTWRSALGLGQLLASMIGG